MLFAGAGVPPPCDEEEEAQAAPDSSAIASVAARSGTAVHRAR
jgi:hypothetical protein